MKFKNYIIEDSIKSLVKRGNSFVDKLNKIGRSTDADNIKRSIEKFTKAEDMTMLDRTVDTAEKIYKRFDGK